MLQEFAKQVKNTVNEIISDIHTSIPGKIISYNAENCEATVQPYGKFKKPNGQFIDYPQLNNIPVYFMQTQDFCFVYPLKAGDECLILSQEQTLDIWRGSGTESNDDLRFDLTNAVAIVGMFARPQPLAKEAQDNNKLIISKNEHRLEISQSEMKIVYNNSVNITLNGNGITLTAPQINLVGTVTGV